MANEPKPMIYLGQKIAPWGTVGAIGTRDGEAFVMLTAKDGGVSLMPRSVVEAHMELNRRSAVRAAEPPQ